MYQHDFLKIDPFAGEEWRVRGIGRINEHLPPALTGQLFHNGHEHPHGIQTTLVTDDLDAAADRPASVIQLCIEHIETCSDTGKGVGVAIGGGAFRVEQNTLLLTETRWIHTVLIHTSPGVGATENIFK